MGKESLKDFIVKNVKELIVDLIPIESILHIRPKGYMYIFGIISISMMTALFLYNLIDVYIGDVTSAFISVSQNSGDCSAVVRPVTGSFIADTDGNWEGFGDFTYSGGKFNLILTGAEMSLQQYQDVMVVARDQLASLGNFSVNLDLASNLALIMSWAMICDPNIYPVCATMQEQYFVFTGSSQYIFLSSNVHPSFSNMAGDCLTKSTAEYDLPSAMQIATFATDQFVASDLCANIINLAHVRPISSNKLQQISIDVRTFGDAVGISNGFLALAGIEIVPGAPDENLEIYFQGHTYIGNYYIDSYYVGMEAIYCILNSGSQDLANENPPIASMTEDGLGVVQLCFIPMGNLLTLPLLNHYGASAGDKDGVNGLATAEPCDCSKKSGHSAACDMFNLLSSFVFYDDADSAPPDTTSQILKLLALVVNNQGYDKISSRAYNASFASAAVSRDPSLVDPIVNSSEWRENAYAFCNYSCSMLVINSYGSSLEDYAMTEYMFQMVNGSCSDIYSMSDQTLQTLQQQPPTPITERYLQCTMKPIDAFNDAIGIAAGNATTLVPMLFLLLLPIFYFFETFVGVDLHGHCEYTQQEVDDVTDELMILLLRAEDKKFRSMTDEKGPIRVLAKELAEFAEARRAAEQHAESERKSKKTKKKKDNNSNNNNSNNKEEEQQQQEKEHHELDDGDYYRV